MKEGEEDTPSSLKKYQDKARKYKNQVKALKQQLTSERQLHQ